MDKDHLNDLVEDARKAENKRRLRVQGLTFSNPRFYPFLAFAISALPFIFFIDAMAMAGRLFSSVAESIDDWITGRIYAPIQRWVRHGVKPPERDK